MKFLKTLSALFLLFFITTLLQSCCRQEYRLNGQGFLSAREVDSLQTTDTIRNAFIIGASFDVVIACNTNFSLIPSAHAFQCLEIPENQIEESSISISVDRSIILNGDTIPAGADLSELPNSVVVIQNLTSESVQFRFTQTFIDNAVMPDGDYIFQFRGNTTDGIPLLLNRSLNLQL